MHGALATGALIKSSKPKPTDTSFVMDLSSAKFDFDVAWQIGSLVRDLGLTRGSPIVVDVRSFGQPLFYSALPGSVPDNAEWIRRKTIRPLVRCDGP